MVAWLHTHTGLIYLILLAAGAVGAFLATRLNASILEVGSVFTYLRQNLRSAREAQCLLACLVVFQLSVIVMVISRFAAV